MSASPEKIIDFLGGTVKVAALCRVTKGAVSQWKKNGIPGARRMFLEEVRPDAFAPDNTGNDESAGQSGEIREAA